MSVKSRLGMVGALLAATLTVTGCGGDEEQTASGDASNAASKPIELSVGYLPIADEMTVKIGEQRGIFEKHGIKLKIGRAGATGTAQIGQLLNGQLQVGLFALTTAMTAVSENIPVRTVSAITRDFDVDNTTAYAAVARPNSSVRSFKDLEGKSVAVNTLKGVWEVSLREAIAKDGGDPSKVKLVAIPFADQIAALKQNRVAAIFTLQPFVAQLVADGFRNLGDAQAIALGDPESVATVTVMSEKFIAEKPEAVRRWVAALSEASQYANAHPDEVRRTIISETKAPAELINNAPVPVFTTVIPEGTVEKWSELLVKYGAMKSPVSAEEVLWEGTPRTEAEAQELVNQVRK